MKPDLFFLVPTFADRGCCLVCTTDPHLRILGFLDQSRYFFIQVAPRLYSQGWVDTVPDPLLLRKSGSAGNWMQDLWICSRDLWPLDYRDDHICISEWETGKLLKYLDLANYWRYGRETSGYLAFWQRIGLQFQTTSLEHCCYTNLLTLLICASNIRNQEYQFCLPIGCSSV
jgi:hypothetical protein